jgi:hypothetical protein
MNELEIIRSQLAVEQAHAAAVVQACVTAVGSSDAAFQEACVGYLVWVFTRFEERDQTLSDLLASRQSPADSPAGASARLLTGLLDRPGTSREALLLLEAALGAGKSQSSSAGWQVFARFFSSSWAPRRAALEGALMEHLGVADWRTVCAIDADSILDERKRFARVTGGRS